jgi:hypothetical protein
MKWSQIRQLLGPKIEYRQHLESEDKITSVGCVRRCGFASRRLLVQRTHTAVETTITATGTKKDGF